MQSGEQVLRLDELQDIDELFVVEVRIQIPDMALGFSTLSSNHGC